MKSLLRKFLPQSFLSKLKKTLSSFDHIIYPIFAKNSFLSSLYYCFFSTQFRREHQSVLQGRLKYQASLVAIEQSSALLRRNTHRLEKGLIMQPRRSIFAEDYILETVEHFCLSTQQGELCKEEWKWAADVLTEYFSVVGSSDITQEARELFEAVTPLAVGTKKSIPYPHATLPETDITYDQLNNLLQRRRSVRWYQDKPVEDLKLAQAVGAASLAPSACNRQPYRFYIANDSHKATDIAKCAMGTAGFAENLQCVVVVVGDLSAYPMERDRHVIYIDASLASMQFMLACETLGLSTCPINWPDIEAREQMMEKKLQLKPYERPIMLIAVGYGDANGGVPFSQKKGNEILIKGL